MESCFHQLKGTLKSVETVLVLRLFIGWSRPNSIRCYTRSARESLVNIWPQTASQLWYQVVSESPFLPSHPTLRSGRLVLLSANQRCSSWGNGRVWGTTGRLEETQAGFKVRVIRWYPHKCTNLEYEDRLRWTSFHGIRNILSAPNQLLSSSAECSCNTFH